MALGEAQGELMEKAISLPNGRSWKTQAAALAHFKDMLACCSDNQIVEDRSDHDDLVALLERYDAVITDSPAKIGCGIDCFFRRQNVGEGYSTPGFWVRRTDGTDTDFSYIGAVKGQPKSNARPSLDGLNKTAIKRLVLSDLSPAPRVLNRRAFPVM